MYSVYVSWVHYLWPLSPLFCRDCCSARTTGRHVNVHVGSWFWCPLQGKCIGLIIAMYVLSVSGCIRCCCSLNKTLLTGFIRCVVVREAQRELYVPAAVKLKTSCTLPTLCICTVGVMLTTSSFNRLCCTVSETN